MSGFESGSWIQRFVRVSAELSRDSVGICLEEEDRQDLVCCCLGLPTSSANGTAWRNPADGGGGHRGEQLRPFGGLGAGTAHVRVVSGEIEVGGSEEGEWLALMRSPRDREGFTALSVGPVDGDDLHVRGRALGEAEVPVNTSALGVRTYSCPPHGCVEREVERELRRLDEPAELCRVDVDLVEDVTVEIALDWPLLGPASCEVR